MNRLLYIYVNINELFNQCMHFRFVRKVAAAIKFAQLVLLLHITSQSAHAS